MYGVEDCLPLNGCILIYLDYNILNSIVPLVSSIILHILI